MVTGMTMNPRSGTRGAYAAAVRAAKAVVTVLSMLCAGFANAAGPEQIETELVAEVRSESLLRGQPFARFLPATAIVQGQTVYYTVRIHNPTREPVHDVVTVQRVPVNTGYVIGSAAGPAAEISFSIDGGQSFAAESQLRITEATGVERRPVSAEYTHIRWRLRNALAPGATALARFQAVFR